MRKSERDKLRWLTSALLGFVTAIIFTYWLGLSFWGLAIIFALTTVGVQKMALKDESAQVTVDSQETIKQTPAAETLLSTTPPINGEPSKRAKFLIRAWLIAMAIMLPLAILGAVAENSEKEKLAQQQATKEQSEDIARQEKKKAEISEERTKNEAAAKQKDMSYENYIIAKERFSEAYYECVSQVKERAKWGAKKDYLPKVSWSEKKGLMIIVGRDIKIKNAFNAERYVEYTCLHDMAKNETTVLSIE